MTTIRNTSGELGTIRGDEADVATPKDLPDQQGAERADKPKTILSVKDRYDQPGLVASDGASLRTAAAAPLAEARPLGSAELAAMLGDLTRIALGTPVAQPAATAEATLTFVAAAPEVPLGGKEVLAILKLDELIDAGAAVSNEFKVAFKEIKALAMRALGNSELRQSLADGLPKAQAIALAKVAATVRHCTDGARMETLVDRARTALASKLGQADQRRKDTRGSLPGSSLTGAPGAARSALLAELETLFGDLPSNIEQVFARSPLLAELFRAEGEAAGLPAGIEGDLEAPAPGNDTGAPPPGGATDTAPPGSGVPAPDASGDGRVDLLPDLPPELQSEIQLPEPALVKLEETLRSDFANFANMDIDMVVQLVLFQANKSDQDSLRELIKEVDANNKKKAAQRDFISQMKQRRAAAETQLRARYDERVRNGEIDPSYFKFEDYKESQTLNVLPTDGRSSLPGDRGTDPASGDFTFAVSGEDVAVPSPPSDDLGGPESAPTEGTPPESVVSASATLPAGLSEETFAERLHITVDELHSLQALYNTIPDRVLARMTGMGNGGRLDFTGWLLRPVDMGGGGLEAVEGGASQSAKVQIALTTVPAKVEAESAELAEVDARKAAEATERQRLATSYGLSEDQVRKLQFDYRRFDERYASLEQYMMQEVKLTKLGDVSGNAAKVDARFDTSGADARTAGIAQLAQFAETFGLSRGAALALWDRFRASAGVEPTDFSAIPVGVLSFLEENVSEFAEFDNAANGPRIEEWLKAISSAGPAELVGSYETQPYNFQNLMGEIGAVAFNDGGGIRDSNSDAYKDKARAASGHIKQFANDTIGADGRASLDSLLTAFFRAMMFESYFKAQDKNQGKRDWFSPTQAYEALVSAVQGMSPVEGFAADYVELRVAEFQRDVTASMSASARGALGDQLGEAATGAATAAATTAAGMTAAGLVLFVPAAMPFAAAYGAVDGFLGTGDQQFYSAFLPKDAFGNDGTDNWELFDEAERKEKNPENKNDHWDNTDEKGAVLQYGMVVSTKPKDSTFGQCLEFLASNDFFGSSFAIADGKPTVGYLAGGRESREIRGFPTSNFRNDVFQSSDSVKQAAAAAAAARASLAGGGGFDNYGNSADRRAFDQASGYSSRDLNRDGTIDQADITLAEQALQAAKDGGGTPKEKLKAIKEATKKLAILRAVVRAKEKVQQKVANAQAERQRRDGYLLAPDPRGPAVGQEDETTGSGATGSGPRAPDGGAPTGQDSSAGLQSLTLADLDAKIEGWKSQLDSFSDLSESLQLRLQLAMERYTKIQQTLSNLMKKIADTQSGIIANLK